MSIEDDLVTLFESHGLDVKRAGQDKHVRKGWIGLECPFCGNVGKFHMGVNVHFLTAHCWGCGGHPLYEVVRALDRGLPWAAFKDLRERRERTTTKFDNTTRPGRYKEPPGLYPLSGTHRQMLLDRGIACDHPDFDRLWRLQSIDYSGGPYKFRMFIPIMLGGEAVSFTTRGRGGGQRYLSASPDMEKWPHKKLLYGEDHVRDAVIVVEGPLDALRIGPGAVATFGTEFTPAQVTRISRYPKRIICYDSEPHAQRQADRLAKLLMPLPGKTWTATVNAKDPGSASEKELKQLRALLGR